MSKGFIRCEFMSPTSGLQCEIWMETVERQYDSAGQMLPILCPDHQNGALVSEKETFIANQNSDKEYAYQFFVGRSDDEGFTLLEEHLAKIEAEIERQKNKMFAVRAVKAEKLANLSESERLERLKYKPEKREKSAATSKAAEPTEKIIKAAEKTGRSMTSEQARDMLEMDPEDFIAKYQKKKTENKS